MSGPVLSRPFALSDSHGARDVTVAATEAERAALAAEYGLVAVGSFAAALTVAGDSAGGVTVEGRVTADIVQECVVTLVPVAQHIDEPVSVRFVRPGSPELEAPPAHGEIAVDPAAPDPPEVLTGSSVDLGPIVEEAFVLAIDPYPRAPGAELPPVEEAEDAPASPFAVLAGLKRARE